MPDLRRATENTDAAASVKFQLNSGVRHLVPVDRESRAGQISGASQAHAAALREFAEFFFPVGNLNDAANALGEIDSSKAKEIRCHGVWGFHDAKAQIRRINLEFLGDFV